MSHTKEISIFDNKIFKNILEKAKNGDQKRNTKNFHPEIESIRSILDEIANPEEEINSQLESILPYKMNPSEIENFLCIFSPFFFLNSVAAQHTICNDNKNGFVRFHYISRDEVLHQIEYYFSEMNLKKDNFIRENIDRNGFINVHKMLQFPLIKYNLVSYNLFLECAVESEKIEVYGDFLRSRHHWWMYKQVSLDEKPDDCIAYNCPMAYMKDVLMGRVIPEQVNETSFLLKIKDIEDNGINADVYKDNKMLLFDGNKTNLENQISDERRFRKFEDYIDKSRVGFYDITSDNSYFFKNKIGNSNCLKLIEIAASRKNRGEIINKKTRKNNNNNRRNKKATNSRNLKGMADFIVKNQMLNSEY